MTVLPPLLCLDFLYMRVHPNRSCPRTYRIISNCSLVFYLRVMHHRSSIQNVEICLFQHRQLFSYQNFGLRSLVFVRLNRQILLFRGVSLLMANYFISALLYNIRKSNYRVTYRTHSFWDNPVFAFRCVSGVRLLNLATGIIQSSHKINIRVRIEL